MSTTRTAAPSKNNEVFASVREWEALTGNDQTITINGGWAFFKRGSTRGRGS